MNVRVGKVITGDTFELLAGQTALKFLVWTPRGIVRKNLLKLP